MMNPLDHRSPRVPPDPEEEAKRLVARWRRLVEEMPDETLDDELVRLLEMIHHVI